MKLVAETICVFLESTRSTASSAEIGAVRHGELETLRDGRLPSLRAPPAEHAPVDEHDAREHVTNRNVFRLYEKKSAVTSGWYSPVGMTPGAAASSQSLATASGLLLGTLAAAMGVGLLVGWLFGGWEIGLLVGAVAGIPLAVLVVYLVYSRQESA